MNEWRRLWLFCGRNQIDNQEKSDEDNITTRNETGKLNHVSGRRRVSM
jgi:hypothetical protein